jgi:hypothetical protein
LLVFDLQPSQLTFEFGVLFVCLFKASLLLLTESSELFDFLGLPPRPLRLSLATAQQESGNDPPR